MAGRTWTWTKGLAVAGTLASSLLMGANVKAAPESSEEAPATSGSLNPFDLPVDFGWLSDPKAPANDLGEALFGGKISLNNRLRWEYANTSNRPEAASTITNRTRLGYVTKALNGFSGFIELENNTPLNRDAHHAPFAGQGDASKAIVADPEEVELNQAYIKYSSKEDVMLDVIVGRQRIIVDDARFIGNVGWRQMEQTYDAVNIKSDLGVENFNLQYAYIWKVNRIFTEEAIVNSFKPFDSQTHLIHASYQFCDALKLTGFVYLMDLENEAGDANSNATYGVTGAGKIKLDDTWSFVYKLTYAHQTDYADNTTEYETDFFAIDAKLKVKDLGWGGVGFQLLGSDNGAVGFNFPLGTNHAYQGWADTFLNTPADGLEDFYFYFGTKLPCGVVAKFFYHDYSANDTSLDYGHEYDIVLVKKINKNWTVLAKFADYDHGDSGKADATKFWLETTFSF